MHTPQLALFVAFMFAAVLVIPGDAIKCYHMKLVGDVEERECKPDSTRCLYMAAKNADGKPLAIQACYPSDDIAKCTKDGYLAVLPKFWTEDTVKKVRTLVLDEPTCCTDDLCNARSRAHPLTSLSPMLLVACAAVLLVRH